MAKRGKKVVKATYEFKHRKKFEELLKQKPEKRNGCFLGFKLKNQNLLWRWDTLEDVE